MPNPTGPKPKPPEEQRTVGVPVYLTPAEAQAVRTLATFYATPVSRLIREIVLEKIEKVTEVP